MIEITVQLMTKLQKHACSAMRVLRPSMHFKYNSYFGIDRYRAAQVL